MSNTFPQGGTNITSQTYTTTGVVVGGQNQTITNDPSGSFLFTPPPGSIESFVGDLNNSGMVSFIPSAAGAGLSISIGNVSGYTTSTLPDAVLNQTGGTILIKDTQANAPSPYNQPYLNPPYTTRVFLNFKNISNDLYSVIDIESSGSINFEDPDIRPPVENFSSAGIFKVFAANGFHLQWGDALNNTGDFNNAGNFLLDGGSGTGYFYTAYDNIINTGVFHTINTFTDNSYDGPTPSASDGNVLNESQGKIIIDDGAFSTHGNILNNGNIQVSHTGFVRSNSNIINNGIITLDNSTLTSDVLISGNFGAININNSSTIKFGSAPIQGTGQTINVSGNGNVLDFSDTIAHANGQQLVQFQGAVTGISDGLQIGIGELHGTVIYDKNTGALLFSSDSGQPILSINVGIGLPGTFIEQNVGGWPLPTYYTIIYYPNGVPCFVSGTLIRTSRGDRPVEVLKAGDVIATPSGRQRRIIWLGSRSVNCLACEKPQKTWPYRVCAHAFGENRPARDLWLSPDHAVAVSCLSDVLIPIKHLDNGATIAQVPMDKVTYWHVELEEHDLLVVENLPAESFLDTMGKTIFHEDEFERGEEGFTTRSGQPQAALPRRKTWKDDACLPLVTEGPVVDAIRVQLLGRAKELGWTLSDAAEQRFEAEGADGELCVWRLSDTLFRLTFPATMGAIVLASNHFVPRHTDISTHDDRRLGVPLRCLELRDLQTSAIRSIPLDDPALNEGFHQLQEWQGERWRWTNGKGVLAPSLWAHMKGDVMLEIQLATDRGQMRSWKEPAAGSPAEMEHSIRMVHNS